MAREYPKQRFVPVLTVADVDKDRALQAKYDVPGAIPLDSYFPQRGIRDTTKQDMMRRYTPIRRATAAAWDTIFKGF